MRCDRDDNPEQMTLGEFIQALEAVDPLSSIYFEFACCPPTEFDSYRGYYDHLALGFAGDYGAKGQTVADLLEQARKALGAEFTGWKGGDYTMHEDTPLWVANPGNTGSTAIVGVREVVYGALIETAWKD